MAKASGTDLAGFDAQLATTQMFYTPKEAVASPRARPAVATMDHVRSSCSIARPARPEGEAATRSGSAFPRTRPSWATARNVKLRFDRGYMELAADGASSERAMRRIVNIRPAPGTGAAARRPCRSCCWSPPT